ncbi:aminoglycoside phosphotransferase family protein [Kineococcus endophyticus]|uniref:Aminoglycoside phosphotransferase family protein n=1 Tax=Kineococcus endophyticus TaxID=1181883 RepID=A0ABV3P1R8_9ACTN
MSSAGGGMDRPDPVLAQLRALGHPGAHWLGAGMEADVYALDENTVARLPRSGTTTGPLDRLLEELSGRGLPFAVPATLGRFALPDGRVLQRQPWLRGRSIGDFHDPSTGYLDVRAEEVLVELLSALHTLGGQQPVAAPELPLLGGRARTTAQNWSTPLQQLLAGRGRGSVDLLRSHVDGVDDLRSACSAFLEARQDVVTSLQHGDICPENVLVDDDCRLSSVLDWGFLTMPADPVLEMATTSSFFDMYGPHALRTDRRLTDLFVEAFSVDRADVLRYKAVYALVGADAYSSDADGHFLWCAALLGRADVRAAVLGWV